MQWIIGDVHAMYYTLIKLIDKIRSLDGEPSFIFVGDYVDRGLHSSKTLDYLIDLQQDGAFFCRGNHDDVVDWFLNDHTLIDIGDMTSDISWNHSVFWWCQNGLVPTLQSYGISFSGKSGDDIVREMREAVPEKHKSFLKELPLYWENDTHFACHGFMYPDRDLPRELRFMKSDIATNSEILWNRFPADPSGGILSSVVPVWDKIGVFGHTPVAYYQMVTAIKHHNIRLIDTGAFMKEYLTGYAIDRDDFVSVCYDSRDIFVE